MDDTELLKMILDKVDRLQEQVSRVVTRVAVFDSVFDALTSQRRRITGLMWTVGGGVVAAAVGSVILVVAHK
jgi:hypothetical protein